MASSSDDSVTNILHDPIPSSGHLPSTVGNPNAVDAFVVSLYINAVFAALVLIVFSYCYHRFPYIYSPRQAAVNEQSSSNAAAASLTQLLTEAVSASDETLKAVAGTDAYLLSRFFYVCFRLFGVCALLGCVLVPIHWKANQTNNDDRQSLTDFDMISIAAVQDGSNLLLLHALFVWIIHCTALVLLYQEWTEFVHVRHEHFSLLLQENKGRTLLVEYIPHKTRTDVALKQYFSRLYPRSFDSIYLPKDLTKLARMIQRREAALIALERSWAEWIATGRRPTVSTAHSILTYCCNKKVDAITTQMRRVHRLNERVQLELERAPARKPLISAFVTFNSAVVAHTAAQVETNDQPFEYCSQIAPLPADVYWPALGKSHRAKFIRSIIINILIALLLVFWSVPITFINSFSNLTQLAIRFPVLSFVLSLPPRLLSLLQGYAPALALMLIMLIIPYALEYLTYILCIESYSAQQEMILHFYFLFQIFNFFVVNTLAGSLLPVIASLAGHPIDVVFLLADSIPSVAPFFINFIMLRSLTGFPLQLLQISSLIYTNILKIFFYKTERERLLCNIPPVYNYGNDYPEHLLIFTIGITYSIISPVVLPFVLLYFGFGYVVDVHQCLHVYEPKLESGGRYWSAVFTRIIAAMIVAQLTVIGLFALKESSLASTIVTPLPVVTYAFYRYMMTAYESKARFLTVEDAEKVDLEIQARKAAAETDHGANESKMSESGEFFALSPRSTAEAERRSLIREWMTHPYAQPELQTPAVVLPDIESEVMSKSTSVQIDLNSLDERSRLVDGYDTDTDEDDDDATVFDDSEDEQELARPPPTPTNTRQTRNRQRTKKAHARGFSLVDWMKSLRKEDQTTSS